MISVDPKNPRGIVWVASFPRSGSTWARIFLNRLFEINTGSTEAFDPNRPSRIEANEADIGRYESLLGKPAASASRAEIAALRPIVQRQILEAAGGVVLVKTHNARRQYLGSALISNDLTAGAIYLVRNPLDVVISFAAFCNESIDTTIGVMATAGLGSATDATQVYWQTGSWSENVSSWTEQPDPATLVVRYEDMVTRPVETFTALARHIGFRTEAVPRVVEESAFTRLRAFEQGSGFNERPEGTQKFFREGRHDQWRDVLTVDQVGAVVANHHAEMQRFGYLTDELRALVA